jgi:hypothetical protein
MTLQHLDPDQPDELTLEEEADAIRYSADIGPWRPAESNVVLLDNAADQQRKRVDTARARTAYLGGELYVTDGDDGRPLFITSCGAWTTAYGSVDEVEAWLDAKGAPK